MKLGQVVAAQPSIQALAKLNLPIQAAFKVAKTLKTLSADMMTYDEKRVALLEKWGKKNADGTGYEFDSEEQRAGFNKEYAELLEVDVSPSIEQIDISSLGDAALDPATLFPLIGTLIKE